jgi:hypothetical protein
MFQVHYCAVLKFYGHIYGKSFLSLSFEPELILAGIDGNYRWRKRRMQGVHHGLNGIKVLVGSFYPNTPVPAIVALKMRKEVGFDAGSSYNFGIRNALELESYAKGIRITNEWSYLEDEPVR